MKFGAFASNWEPYSHQPQIYERIAMQAEELGYEFFLTSNHFLRPGIGTSQLQSTQSDATIDTWSLLPYLAAKTRTIKIGSCVTPVSLYNPFFLAKITSTVDVLSNGRLIFGAGAGYERREFEIYGTWDEEARIRVKKVEEALNLIKKLWTEERVNFSGNFFQAKDAVNEPKPKQGASLPIWSGAMSSGMLHVTAKLANVWIPSHPLGATLEFYSRSSKKLSSYAKESSRSVKQGLLGNIVDDGYKSSMEIVGTLASCAKKLEEYRSLGMEYFAANFLPPDKTLELMKKFYQDIIPSFV